jgi:hypothetical protein
MRKVLYCSAHGPPLPALTMVVRSTFADDAAAAGGASACRREADDGCDGI